MIGIPFTPQRSPKTHKASHWEEMCPGIYINSWGIGIPKIKMGGDSILMVSCWSDRILLDSEVDKAVQKAQRASN